MALRPIRHASTWRSSTSSTVASSGMLIVLWFTIPLPTKAWVTGTERSYTSRSPAEATRSTGLKWSPSATTVFSQSGSDTPGMAATASSVARVTWRNLASRRKANSSRCSVGTSRYSSRGDRPGTKSPARSGQVPPAEHLGRLGHGPGIGRRHQVEQVAGGVAGDDDLAVDPPVHHAEVGEDGLQVVEQRRRRRARSVTVAAPAVRATPALGQQALQVGQDHVPGRGQHRRRDPPVAPPSRRPPRTRGRPPPSPTSPPPAGSGSSAPARERGPRARTGSARRRPAGRAPTAPGG